MALGSIDIRRYLLQNWDAVVCGVFYSDVDDQWFIGYRRHWQWIIRSNFSAPSRLFSTGPLICAPQTSVTHTRALVVLRFSIDNSGEKKKISIGKMATRNVGTHKKPKRKNICPPPLVRLHKKNHLILSDLAAPLLLCKSLCWMKIPIENKKNFFL